MTGETHESDTPVHNCVVGQLVARLQVALAQGRQGHVLPFTEFALGAGRLRPDVAVLLGDVAVHRVPALAVEVIADDLAIPLERKTRIYLEQGVEEVWCVYPELACMVVYQTDSIRHLKANDTLTSPLLPGWSVEVRDLFPAQ
ncbi:MAG: Uma2 family endonuclease [Bryobacteraceae bacterium]